MNLNIEKNYEHYFLTIGAQDSTQECNYIRKAIKSGKLTPDDIAPLITRLAVQEQTIRRILLSAELYMVYTPNLALRFMRHREETTKDLTRREIFREAIEMIKNAKGNVLVLDDQFSKWLNPKHRQMKEELTER